MHANRIRSALSWLAVLAILTFIGRHFLGLWPDIKAISWSFSLLPCGISVLLLVVSFILMAFTWLALAMGMGERISVLDGMTLYFFTSLGRYIPGKIWTVLGAASMAGQFNCSALNIGSSMFYLTLINLQIGLLISISGGIFFGMGHDLEISVLYKVLLLAAVAVMLVGFVMNGRVIRLIQKILRRNMPLADISFKPMCAAYLLVLTHWVLESLAYYFLIRSFYPLSFTDFPQLLYSVSASTTAGFLALFAPAGLGVREGVLIVLLGQFMPDTMATAATISSRVWFTVVDMFTVFGIIFLCTLVRRSHGKPHPGPKEPCAGL